MKKVLVFSSLIAMCLFFGTPGIAQERPEEGKDGIWIQKYDVKGIDKKFYYAVDTVTQQCFSIVRIGTGAGYTIFPCANLKRRPEWKTLIRWEN